MELTVNLKPCGVPTARKAASIADAMTRFESQVLLRRGNVTVNAKSLVGLLSLQLEEGAGVTIIANGVDEAQAVCAMAKMLQEERTEGNTLDRKA